jgi:hypothetical protein
MAEGDQIVNCDNPQSMIDLLNQLVVEDSNGKPCLKTCSSGVSESRLVWAATGNQEQNIVIVQDIETLINIVNTPFASYNASNVIFDTANNWIDISGIDNNAWLEVIVTYLGVNGDADITPSIRLMNDRNDLNTYFATHGQTSIQKNGKTSSYSVKGFNGGTDVLQVYIETDKNEILSVKSIRINITLP